MYDLVLEVFGWSVVVVMLAGAVLSFWARR